MKEFWLKLGEKLSYFFFWALDHHPGKFIGTLSGFLLGLLIVTLGFWRALVLFLFVALGFLLGKRQDDHNNIATWVERIFNK